jgi:hypothetical protein
MNEDIEDDEKKMTMEQFVEELRSVDVKKEFEKYDEEIKIYNQKYIEKNYPRYSKSKPEDESRSEDDSF